MRRWAVVAFCCWACGESRGPPPAPAIGRPSGASARLTIGSSGGTLTDGSLTLVIPAGAVAADTDFEIAEVDPNDALGAVGSEYSISASGPLAAPIALVFAAPAGVPVDSVTAAEQAPSGYWLREYSVARDETAQALTVSTSYLGNWSLATVATAQDLTGPLQLTSTLGTPFTATGTVTLEFIGQDSGEYFYLPVGALTPDSPVGTCTPDLSGPEALQESIADLVPGTAFEWGLGAQWTLTCDDGSRGFISTDFDTFGITNLGCARSYDSLPILDPAHVQGQYTIDCGVNGSVTASWDLAPAP